MTGYLDQGYQSGARAAAGGHRHGDRGYFVEPTVLVDAPNDASVVQEEIFGPVVVAMPFDDIDEIARQANDTRYGLAAGIWTQDISKAHELACKLRAGSVFVNTYNSIDPALPFGGFKESGWGRELGPPRQHHGRALVLVITECQGSEAPLISAESRAWITRSRGRRARHRGAR